MRPGASLCEKTNSRAIAMQGSYIDIRASCLDPDGCRTGIQISVHQCPDVFIAPVPRTPKMMQLMKHMTRHFERPPNPIGGSPRPFHLNFTHRAAIKNDGVKQ